MIKLEPVNIYIQPMHEQEDQEAPQLDDEFSKFKAFQNERGVCYSSLFFFDLFHIIEENLTPVIQHWLHQTDPQAFQELPSIAEGFNTMLEFIRTYEFNSIHQETICPQCLVEISAVKKQMIGFLEGVKAGPTPYEVSQINGTKQVLHMIIQARAEWFMNRCHAKATKLTH